MRVLIVEDEYLTRTFLTSIIDWNNNNMELIGVSKDGKEAFEIIENNRVDVVITDLKMPKMDGNTLIKNLKNINYKGKIIVLSNYSDFELVKDAMKNGAFEYLLKATVTEEELLEVLNKVRDELSNNIDTTTKEDILNTSDERIKINRYIQTYLKGEEAENIEEYLNNKYLLDHIFIYLRILSTDIDGKDKEISSFLLNIISNYIANNSSKFISLVKISKNEYSVIIKNRDEINVDLLISSVSKNIKQYLDISFEKIVYKTSKNLEESLEVINHERENSKYIIDSRIIECRKEIKKVIEYININLDKKISLDVLSTIATMNESYLSRIFKEEVNMTISDYIKLKRLERAKELLQDKDKRIKDVAMEVGIQDQLYFSRLFTKYFNITPSDYRCKVNNL